MMGCPLRGESERGSATRYRLLDTNSAPVTLEVVTERGCSSVNPESARETRYSEQGSQGAAEIR